MHDQEKNEGSLFQKEKEKEKEKELRARGAWSSAYKYPP